MSRALRMLFSASVLTTLTSVLTTLTAGCGGLQNVPLPGGADIGANPYRITAEFSDVLELVPQSLVKVNDVSVGAIQTVQLAPDTWHAIVTMEVNRSVTLPANAVDYSVVTPFTYGSSDRSG